MPGSVLRFALLGLAAALAEPYSEDATVFVQLRTDDTDFEEQDELWEERSFLPPTAEHYAAEIYAPGEIAEGRGKDGAWLPVFITGRGIAGSWNIHVADKYPGYDLPNVPAHLVRKKLQKGQSDWYVDNSVLQHKGLGVKFRTSKDMRDGRGEFAAWGDLVIGSDAGDGWVNTTNGFLPKVVHNATVLVQQDRKRRIPAVPQQFLKDIEAAAKRQQEEAKKQQEEAEELEKIRKAKEEAKAAIVHYTVGERVQLRTRQGKLFSGRIATLSKAANRYDVIVQVDSVTVQMVHNIPFERLRKMSGGHTPLPDESPICQKDGCITVRAVPDNGSEDMLLHVSRMMGTNMMMKMACNRLRIEWDDCLARTTFTYKGNKLTSAAHIYEVSMQEGDVVNVAVAPAAEPSPSSLLEDA